jgi:hypothetical protein
MASLVVPYFHSATILEPHHAAAPLPEAAPWHGVLAVEPDVARLQAKSLLLTKANYCVTRVSSDRELFHLRNTKAVPLAILSDRLGERLLGTVAQTVRRQWPRTRILILGQAPRMLEDYLYDEQIQRSSDPQQVLAELESLYRGMWNRRSNVLDWKVTRAARSFARPQIAESDPAKTMQPAATEIAGQRDTPSDSHATGTRLH